MNWPASHLCLDLSVIFGKNFAPLFALCLAHPCIARYRFCQASEIQVGLPLPMTFASLYGLVYTPAPPGLFPYPRPPVGRSDPTPLPGGRGIQRRTVGRIRLFHSPLFRSLSESPASSCVRANLYISNQIIGFPGTENNRSAGACRSLTSSHRWGIGI